MNKKLKLLFISCCLLLSVVLVSGSMNITSIESKPESLSPLGDAPDLGRIRIGAQNGSLVSSIHLRSGHYGGG